MKQTWLLSTMSVDNVAPIDDEAAFKIIAFVVIFLLSLFGSYKCRFICLSNSLQVLQLQRFPPFLVVSRSSEYHSSPSLFSSTSARVCPYNECFSQHFSSSTTCALRVLPGVILSTAFVHLLQDAFGTLLTLPRESYLRHWVGLIVYAYAVCFR